MGESEGGHMIAEVAISENECDDVYETVSEKGCDDVYKIASELLDWKIKYAILLGRVRDFALGFGVCSGIVILGVIVKIVL
jgi:hypothetical protein